MKTSFTLLATSLALAAILPATAEEPKKPANVYTGSTTVNAGTPATQEALEAAFKTTLTDATFVGRWAGIKNGELTPDKDEKYNIVSVEKGTGDNWTINAKMKYGKNEIVAPIPVQVKWAGDTAVIVVDNLTIPGGGTYNARVLVFKNTYAGTWSGGDHGGLLSGLIVSGQK